jgi:hypothetical protein
MGVNVDIKNDTIHVLGSDDVEYGQDSNRYGRYGQIGHIWLDRY